MAHDSGTVDPNTGAMRRVASDPMDFFKQATGFAKGKTPEAAATPPQKTAAPLPKKGVPPSIISVNVEMGGQIVSPQELHIYGTIEGDVRATSLVICTGGAVRGEIVADMVTVHGAVEGTIHGLSVQLCAGGVVRGDIVHSELSMERGAIFEGVSRRLEDPMASAPVIVVQKRGEQPLA